MQDIPNGIRATGLRCNIARCRRRPILPLGLHTALANFGLIGDMMPRKTDVGTTGPMAAIFAARLESQKRWIYTATILMARGAMEKK
jgi:hypothetical protein